MKINEVEAAVGVTKKNIRFYEEEGLITPSREPGNGYRSYSQADVERLRRIKLLRKLDVPLAEIREMLEGQPPYVPMLHLPERGRSIDFNRKVRLPQSASQTAPSEMGPLAKHKTLPHCQRLPP